MKIFGMGGIELVIILVVILLIFGPKNLPKLGQAFGRTISSLRDGMSEGRKKKEEAEESEESEASQEASSPAELEASVEDVDIVEDVAFDDGAPVQDVAEAATDAVAEADAVVDEVFESTVAADGAPAGEAPKKVKRVVRKKVASGEESLS